MQTSISAEEFARFQFQLLELRQQKYAVEEDFLRAEKKVEALESAFDHQSSELADLRSRFSRVQHAGSIEMMMDENSSLRQRLLNVESSFQLQSSTLRAECERLQMENGKLRQTCITSSTANAATQTISSSATLSCSSIACQTFKSGWASNQSQTEVTAAVINGCFAKAEKFVELSAILETERSTSQDLLREISQKELDVERLEGECEALLSELSVAEKRRERVERELKRQIVSAVRGAKRVTLGNTPSLSSLVVVPVGDQNLDGISVESFSVCGGSQTAGNDNAEASDSSSGSKAHPQQLQQMFSEEDLKVLLGRLSEVQEENCNLRQQLKYIQSEVDAKSKVIQRELDGKFNSTPAAHHNMSDGSFSTSASSSTAARFRLASDMISMMRSQMRHLQTSSSSSSSAAALGSAELKGLKRLCEELMTRNILLERTLEATVAGSKEIVDD